MSGAFVSGPLDSNTRANPTKAFYGGGGGLVGVTSLNAQIGTLAVTGDASIGITAPGLGAIQVSTAGRPQAVGTLSCTSIATGTGTFTGAVAIASGASVAANLAAGSVTATTVAATGAVSAATLSVGAPGAQGTITYINANITYSGTTQYNVGIPVNYPALITLTASLAVGTGFLNAVFCTVNTGTAQWGLRQVTTGSSGVQYFSVNPDTPAGTQLQVSVPGGGAGTIYTSYKIERSGL